MAPDIVSILFASDFHGSSLCFQTFINLAVELRVTAAIVGGDLTGKYPTFVTRVGDHWEATIGDVRRIAASDEEFHQLKQDIENVGGYPRVVTDYEFERLRNDQPSIDRVVAEEAPVRLRNWLAFADQTLAGPGVRLILMCGNDDPWELDQIIADFPSVGNPDSAPILLEGHYIVGESTAYKTPWGCPRDREEPAIADRINAKLEKVPLPSRKQAIFVFHCPPKDTPLDQAYGTDAKQRTAVSAGQALLKSAGSSAVRAAIERYEPLLSLHGHIHEAEGFCKLGRTLCFNPGSEYAHGVLRAWLIHLRPDSVVDYKLLVR